MKLPLGQGLNEAKLQWAKLECQDIPAGTGLLLFIKEIVPVKAPNT